MMPLMFANTGETNIIKKVGGSPEVKSTLKISVLLPAERLPLFRHSAEMLSLM